MGRVFKDFHQMTGNAKTYEISSMIKSLLQICLMPSNNIKFEKLIFAKGLGLGDESNIL